LASGVVAIGLWNLATSKMRHVMTVSWIGSLTFFGLSFPGLHPGLDVRG
jgi:hypothetical protein